MKIKPFLVVAAVVAWCCAALVPADPLDRIATIERELASLRAELSPATQPTTQPTPEAKPVRADTVKDVKDAIARGEKWIQTGGFTLMEDLDARGALIELIAGGPTWKAAILTGGDAALSNAIIKTPPSIYDGNGVRIGFYKAIEVQSSTLRLENITFAPNIGFCIHVQRGKVDIDSAKATTFTEYFVYQEAGTFVHATNCDVRGGSRAESLYRTSGGRYLIEDSTLDNSGGGKAVLRGDCPPFADGSPGGVVRRTKFVGTVGANPLTEDDGGQMVGIDRWRVEEGWLFQLPASRKPEAIAFAQMERARGKTPAEIVRSTSDRFIDGKELAKVAKGKQRLSDRDIQLTLDFRASEVSRFASFVIEDCEIVGDIRVNARSAGTVRRTKITTPAGLTPFAGNSQPSYPWPADRVIVQGESAPPPAVLFDLVTIEGGDHLGIDLKAFPKLRFTASTYKGQALASEAAQQ